MSLTNASQRHAPSFKRECAKNILMSKTNVVISLIQESGFVDQAFTLPRNCGHSASMEIDAMCVPLIWVAMILAWPELSRKRMTGMMREIISRTEYCPPLGCSCPKLKVKRFCCRLDTRVKFFR